MTLLDLPVELLAIIALEHWSVYYRMQFIRPVRDWFLCAHNLAMARQKFTYKIYDNFNNFNKETPEYIIYPLTNCTQTYLADRLIYDSDVPSISGYDRDIFVQCWIKNNTLHRDLLPAVITTDIQDWYQHGKLHRDDGPAIIYAYGEQLWFQNGKRIGFEIKYTDSPKITQSMRIAIEDLKLDFMNIIIPGNMDIMLEKNIRLIGIAKYLQS